MSTSDWALVIPASLSLIAALTALIRAEAAHRKLDDHVEFTHRVASPIARQPPPRASGPQE